MRHRRAIFSMAASISLAAGVMGLAGLAAGCSEEAAAPAPQSASRSEAPAGEASPSVGTDVQAAVDAIQAMDDFIAQQTVDKTNPRWKTSLTQPPQVPFDEHSYFWDLATNVGKITIRLMPEVAPMHVSSTIYLTQLGFYDGILFHRIIPNFMAQGGDPLGNGRGNPGYRYGGEFDPSVRHDRPGLLSMANSGPGTDGSQFFITFVPTPHLDDKHTIFGEVTEGMDVLEQMEVWRQRGSEHLNDPLVIEKAEVRVE